MIEDKATEKLKKRLKDMGLIVNAGAGRVEPPAAAKRGAASPKSRTSKGQKGNKK